MRTPAQQAFDVVLDALERRGCKISYKPGADKATGQCPAHDDRNASLSIGFSEDSGKVLLHCFAGCAVPEIVASLSLTQSELFAQSSRDASIPPKQRATLQPRHARAEKKAAEGLHPLMQPPATMQPSEGETQEADRGVTLTSYAEYKGLPVAFLRMLRLEDFTYQKKPALRIPYFAENGQDLLCTRYRTGLRKPEDAPDGRFRTKSSDKVALYGLWYLERIRQVGYVVLVEGESDCHTLWYHGISALGIPGASNWNEARHATYLDGIPTIYLVVEPDKGGEAVKKWLATSRIRDRVRLVTLGEHKDPSGLHIACVANPAERLTIKELFSSRWQAALDASTGWVDQDRAERAEQARGAWADCKTLAEKPAILDDFAAALKASGLAGEQRVVKLLYLAVTSRFLPKVVSIALKGPSSAGKSHTTERVLSFFPPQAFYALSAMSERALAYSEEPLSHRILVIYEAAGIRGDFATYLLRSLLRREAPERGTRRERRRRMRC